MNVVKCGNDHFLDLEAFSDYPYCSAKAQSQISSKLNLKQGMFTWFRRKKKTAVNDHAEPLPSVFPDTSKWDAYWEGTNRYFRKRFSIMGDSISTLEGYNPDGYNVFYCDENMERTGVKKYKDTWWGKVIDFFNGELLVNNSWSGSRVTIVPRQNELFPSGCSDERTASLHRGSVSPDVIIVYLGTNDWAFGAYTDETRIIFDENYGGIISMCEKYMTASRHIFHLILP